MEKNVVNENVTKLIGKITLSRYVIVTDPIYSINEWCQVHVPNLSPGVYYCYEQRINDKVARISIIKEGFEFDELEWDATEDVIGMNNTNVGIFDLLYIKENKTTHDKSWRNELIDATVERTVNEKFVPVEESPMYRSFVAKSDRVKNKLREKSIWRKDLLKVIDEIFDYDPNILPKDIKTEMAICPAPFLNQIGLFIENKDNMIKAYKNSIYSKPYLERTFSAVFDGRCFITRPLLDHSPFTCILGHEINKSSVISGIMVDFNILEYDENEELIDDGSGILGYEYKEDESFYDDDDNFSYGAAPSSYVEEPEFITDEETFSSVMSLLDDCAGQKPEDFAFGDYVEDEGENDEEFEADFDYSPPDDDEVQSSVAVFDDDDDDDDDDDLSNSLVN